MIAIAGLFRKKVELKNFLRDLPSTIKISLIIVLGWGALVTFYYSAGDYHRFLKGWSLIVEFEFAVLIAAFILREDGAFQRWTMVSRILVICLGLDSILWMLLPGVFNGTFSSFPTFYSTLSIPLAPMVLLPFFLEKGDSPKVLNFVALFCLASMVLIGLSSGAILSITGSFVLLLILAKPDFKKIRFFLTSVFLVLTIFFLAGFISGNAKTYISRIEGEINQIRSLDDPDILTSAR
ncbi:MAG TPA: hypothetical protein ENN89_05815, partial [Synergistetes bacterium]|nr:hypothetical protein [Synergistota bacterium]